MEGGVQALTHQSFKVPTHLGLGKAPAKLFHTPLMTSPDLLVSLPQIQTSHLTVYKGVVTEENKPLRLTLIFGIV